MFEDNRKCTSLFFIRSTVFFIGPVTFVTRSWYSAAQTRADLRAGECDRLRCPCRTVVIRVPLKSADSSPKKNNTFFA